MLDHPLLAREDILVFQSSVIDVFPKIFSVAGAAPIFRRDDGVALFQQFTREEQFLRRFEIAMHSPVNQNQKWNFFRPRFRNERVSRDYQMIARPLRSRIVGDSRRWPREPHL